MRSIERAMDLDRRRQEKLDAEAAEHAKELEGLRRESVAVAKRVQDHEAAASAAERRSEEHTSELQSLMRISYAVFCLKKKKKKNKTHRDVNDNNTIPQKQRNI